MPRVVRELLGVVSAVQNPPDRRTGSGKAAAHLERCLRGIEAACEHDRRLHTPETYLGIKRGCAGILPITQTLLYS